MTPELKLIKIEERKALKSKVCKNCKEEKLIENFRLQNKESHIYECYCRKCKNRMRQLRRQKGWKRGIPKKKLSYEQQHDRNLKRKFNISREQYLQMVEAQNNLCKICGNPETTLSKGKDKIIALAVDHCHTTGEVRGLLCNSCNAALGNFKDRSDLLQAAINYLKETNSDKTP